MTILRIDLLDIILVVGAAQGVLLAVMIFHQHRRLYANRFLCSLMLCYSVVLMHLILTEIGIYQSHSGLEFVLLSFCFLIGPLHFLYAKFLTNKSARFSGREWLHFAPSVVYIGYRTITFFLVGGNLDPAATENLRVDDLVFNWAIIVQGLAYMVLTIVFLRRHTRRIRQVYATLDIVKLDWLRNITYLVVAVLSIFALENVLFLAHINFSGFFNMSSVLLAVSVYAMGYLGLSRSEVFMDANFGMDLNEQAVARTDGPSPKQAPEHKYERSGLSASQSEGFRKRLLELMESASPYLESDLTLSKLADKLAISPHNLSQVVNLRLQQNFFDFVNQYRVDKVKRDLADPSKENLTLLAIGLDAGFNSKSSFNGVFKRHTGLTPSEFRLRLRDEDN